LLLDGTSKSKAKNSIKTAELNGINLERIKGLDNPKEISHCTIGLFYLSAFFPFLLAKSDILGSNPKSALWDEAYSGLKYGCHRALPISPAEPTPFISIFYEYTHIHIYTFDQTKTQK
jgi:hypothetical protein